MRNQVIPFPGRPTEDVAEQDEAVRGATQDLVAQVTAEDVPERLLALAAELGKALDARKAELSDLQDPDC